jgi:hypothetical protein
LWRNNVGALRDQRGQLVSYGLCRGSSDLIGLRRLTIGPEHLGQSLAVFVAIEVKSERGRLAAEQQQFLEVVREFGGLAGVARSLPEASALLQLGTG